MAPDTMDSCCVFSEQTNVTHVHERHAQGREKVRHLDCSRRTRHQIIDWCFTCHSDECFLFAEKFSRYESSSILRYGEDPESHQFYPGCHEYRISVPGLEEWISGRICLCNDRSNCNEEFFDPPGRCLLHTDDDRRVECTSPELNTTGRHI